jgi:hypothetical protein
MTGAVRRARRGQWTDDEIRCQAAATPDAAHGVTADALPNDGKHDIRNGMQSQCEICGQSFTGNRRRRTCSKLSCQRALHTMNARSLRPQPRVCIICGVEFMSARGDARYCSSPCRQRAYRQRLAVTPPATPP